MNTGRVTGKIILVTGGASGIGAAVVKRFRSEGATLISADLSIQSSTIDADGVHQVHIDVADVQSVDGVINDILNNYGRLDCVVHSAGIAKEIPFLETSIEVFDLIMRVNVRGSFVVGQACARAMIASGGGSIINIASVSGMLGNGQRSAYGSSKGAAITLSKIMAVELARHNVRVNVIAPGPIETPLVVAMHPADTRKEWIDRVPMGRYGTPEEIANAALFLASNESSFVNGHVLAVDGGFVIRGLDSEAREKLTI